jgi:restriction system protein
VKFMSIRNRDNDRDTVPQYDKLLWATVKAIAVIGGSGNIEEIIEKVIEILNLPNDILEIEHKPGYPLLDYRLAWARTYLKKVNAVQNSTRGIWTLTDYGRGITEEQCLEIPSKVRKMSTKDRKETPLVTIENIENDEIYDGSEVDWKQNLLGVLLKMDPTAFERLSQRILRESGFVKVEVTKKSNDGGIDGIGILRMNLVSFTVLFQCKRYQDSVGSSVVRDFRGAMVGRCDKGLIITTGYFTSEAKKEAIRDGAPTIDLIDGDTLCDLLKNLKLGMMIELVEKVTINEDWFNSI